MVECRVCYDLYEREGAKCPKLLPCGHSLCLSCLSKTLKHGHIKCPFCRMALQILSGDAGSLPTNERILTQNTRSSEERKKIYTSITGENKNIYTPLSSGEAPGTDYCETEIWKLHRNHQRGACPLRRKPLTQVTAGGTQQRVCKSCLDTNFIILTLPETADYLDIGDNNPTDREERIRVRIVNRETAQRNDNEQNFVYHRCETSRTVWCCVLCCVMVPFVILILTLIFGVWLWDS